MKRERRERRTRQILNYKVKQTEGLRGEDGRSEPENKHKIN